jgi:hypothetical protein
MVDSELGLTIAFNGCIYNYPELRQELEAKGYRFFSTGDTEVILKAYHAWGPRCVERFNGMFAFAIHERESGRVVLARDRFGIKPLYLAETNGRLLFASSLPGAVATGEVDTDDRSGGAAVLHELPRRGPAPYTMIKGVRKLPPATIRVSSPTARRRTRSTGGSPTIARSRTSTRSFEDWRDMVLDELRRAVKRRMVADVPVGVLLSGGVDSSVIVGLLAEQGQRGLKTFSIGFEEAHGEKGDEFVYSDMIAERFATEHHKIFDPVVEHAGGAARHHQGDVRADGLLRQCRLLPAQPRGRQARQGRAERAGGRRGLRRLSLVSQARELERPGRRLRQRLLRPRRHHREHLSPAGMSIATKRGPSSRRISRRRARTTRWTRRCGSIRPSCWSTIRSSASTT